MEEVKKTLDAILQIKTEVVEMIKKDTAENREAQDKAVNEICDRLDALEANQKTSALAGTGVQRDENLRNFMAGKIMDVAIEGNDAQGGYLVPDYIATEMVQHSANGNPIRDLARHVTISGKDYAEIESGIAAAAWGAEAPSTARAANTTPALTENRAAVFTEYALLPASEELVEDAAFDIESWLVEGASAAFANLESAAFWSGNGTTAPKGIASYTQVVNSSWAVGKIGTETPAGAALAADDLIQLQTALDDVYQSNATWLMNKATFRSTLKLKAGASGANAFLLWQPQLVKGKIENFLIGSPVRQWAAMPNFGAGAASVAYGDIHAAYVVVDRLGTTVTRHVDPYTGKVLFYVRRRVGGMIRNSNAVKLLVSAAASAS